MNILRKNLKKQLKDDLDPSLIYVPLDDEVFSPELELSKKYQAFSTELLRLSLSGIAVIGFIYNGNLNTLFTDAKHYAAISAIFFGFSAVFALFHRYLSSETLRYYLRGLQWESKYSSSQTDIDRWNAKYYLKCRQYIMWWCVFLKFISVIALSIGAGFLASAFIIPLL